MDGMACRISSEPDWARNLPLAGRSSAAAGGLREGVDGVAVCLQPAATHLAILSDFWTYLRFTPSRSGFAALDLPSRGRLGRNDCSRSDLRAGI